MRFSIVIPVFNKWSLTQACLQSLRACRLGDRVEIIVVDNASSDETPQALPAAFPEVRYLRQPQNLNFAGGNNLGAREARGEMLMLLNNDTEVAPDWLDRLDAVFSAHPRTGVAGARLLYPNGRIQHAGVVFDAHRSPVHIYRNLPADFAPALERRRYRVVTGACMLMPTALYRSLGGFDEAYRNGFEDVDLCLRLEAAGHEVWYEPASTVVHHESQTAGRKLHEMDNHALFMSRWGDRIEPELEACYRGAGIGPDAAAVHTFLLGCGEPQGYLPLQWEIGRDAGDAVRKLAERFREECAALNLTLTMHETDAHAGALAVMRPDAGALRQRTYLCERTDANPPDCDCVVRVEADRLRAVTGVDSGREHVLEAPLLASLIGFRSGGNAPAHLLARGRALIGTPAEDAYIETFAALFNHDVEPIMLRAEAAARRGDTATAETLYDLCHRLDPRRSDVVLRLTDLMLASGRRPQARRVLRGFLKVKPVHLGAHWRLLRAAWPGGATDPERRS